MKSVLTVAWQTGLLFGSRYPSGPCRMLPQLKISIKVHSNQKAARRATGQWVTRSQRRKQDAGRRTQDECGVSTAKCLSKWLSYMHYPLSWTSCLVLPSLKHFMWGGTPGVCAIFYLSASACLPACPPNFSVTCYLFSLAFALHFLVAHRFSQQPQNVKFLRHFYCNLCTLAGAGGWGKWREWG